MKICCILNNNSGSADSAKHNTILDLFASHGVNVKILKLTDGASITELARSAVQEDYDVIVAGGGDGTINAVASALVGHPLTRLGILPLGTLNHFARDLGIPFDLTQAVEIICTGYSESVDVGAVNDQYFLNNSSIGLYPAIVKLRESLQSAGYGKWWAAFVSSLRILRKFRRFDLEVQPSTGAFINRKAALLFIGNNVYETAVTKLGTRLAIDRGQLWINMPTASTLFGFFKNLMSLMFGREKPADTLIFEATSLKVMSKKRLLTVATDGEILRLKPPLNYRILPKVLKVIVPVRELKS